jgi:GNAT superfamily N-acetyltransferase
MSVPDVDVTVLPLAPERLGDYLAFFDSEAFTDNPDWSGCYCLFYHLACSDDEWGARTGAQNRAAKSDLIRAGRAHGLLAYVDGRVVGWCHAAPYAELPRLPDAGARAGVGAIPCFIVAPGYRGRGIATRLLDAACAYLRDLGLHTVEAHAVKEARTAAQAYHGTLAMYGEAGFEPVEDLGRMVLVRKALGSP